jgi:hypothetical protein
MVPFTSTLGPLRRAWSSTVTPFVVPCKVKSPVAVTLTGDESVGMFGSAIGWVSVNVAIGKDAVSMIRPWNCASLRLSSLATFVMSAWSATCVTDEPSMVIVPVTAFVRPAASCV